MLDNLKKYDVVLASNSPRRRELLAMLGVDFRVAVPKGVEENHEGVACNEVAEYLARKKVQAYIDQLYEPGQLVIASDTVVILGNQVLGKPRTEAEARQMLNDLSGKTHHVVSGVAVYNGTEIKWFSACTEVTFASLTAEEIDWYVKHFKPLDKAGAYGIQEWIGAMGVREIKGSYYNVMGLPTSRLYQLLSTM